MYARVRVSRLARQSHVAMGLEVFQVEGVLVKNDSAV